MTEFAGRDHGGPTAHDAEVLVRNLIGVADVRIITAPGGALRQILVVPESDSAARQVSRNVASALMARFGLDLGPDAVTVAAPAADTSFSVHDRTDPSTAAPPANGNGARNAQPMTHREAGPDVLEDRAGTTGPGQATHRGNGNGRTRARVTRASNAPAAPPAMPPAPYGDGMGWRTAGNGNGAAGTSGTPHRDPLSTPAARSATQGPHRDGRYGSSHRLRLEAAELVRSNGNTRCRVILAAGSERFEGVGDGDHDRVSDIDLAGRVTVDALRAARIPRVPIQFEGAVLVDIGGRAHVATSLSIWTGHDFDVIAGAAPLLGSPAESAARAVVDAVVARLIA